MKLDSETAYMIAATYMKRAGDIRGGRDGVPTTGNDRLGYRDRAHMMRDHGTVWGEIGDSLCLREMKPEAPK